MPQINPFPEDSPINVEIQELLSALCDQFEKLEDYDRVIEFLREERRWFRDISYLNAISPILKESRIVIPSHLKHLTVHGPCVYFLEMERKQGWIKIGQTRSLRNRVKQLRQENRCGKVTVLLYVETDQCRVLERALHIQFNDERDGRTEWFYAPSIMELVDELKALPNAVRLG